MESIDLIHPNLKSFYLVEKDIFKFHTNLVNQFLISMGCIPLTSLM